MNGIALTPDALEARFLSSRAPHPTLFVVVDTEEEFDWASPFSRDNVSVRAMRRVESFQRLCSRYDIRPTYVIDFPVATQADGYLPLIDAWKDGDCCIGAHMHPWVNPPFLEEVSAFNSYGCNLEADLERQKIEALRDAIGERFGPPAVFKAGRYALGLSTATTIEALGFDVDASINPTLRASPDGGPSFEAFDSRPFLFGNRMTLELPCTHGYVGWAGSFRRPLHRIGSTPALEAIRTVGILLRLGAVNRIMLSPELGSAKELIGLTRTLHDEGLDTFSLTLHSPSLEPGHTPYVRTPSDLARFLDTSERFFDFFFGELGGTASTPVEFRLACLGSEQVTS